MKKIKTLALIFSLTFSLGLTSCQYHIEQALFRPADSRSRSTEIQTYTESTEIKSPSVGSSAVYSAVIITDPHFGAKKERFDEKFYEWMENAWANPDESLRPRFMLCLGDVAEHGFKEEFETYVAFTETIKQKAKENGFADFEVYTILGNHDCFGMGWKEYKKIVSPFNSYYRFKTNGLSDGQGFWWYFLDSASGSLGNKQLEDFTKHMYEDDIPRIVLSHYPIYQDDLLYFTTQNTDERDKLLDLCSKTNTKLVLSGHHHPGGESEKAKFYELGLRAYLAQECCALITVDENTKDVTIQEHKIR